MKYLEKASLIILILLSLSAGVAKLMRLPNEVEFFQSTGLSVDALMIFGAFQVVGAILLAIPRFRKFGLAVVIACLLASSVMIFVHGNFTFGVFSLLPVILAAFVAQGLRDQKNNSAAD